MKRGWVYIVVGPILGVLGSLLWEIIRVGVDSALRDPAEGMMLAWVFGLLVSGPSLLIDTGLARFLPIAVRAPLMAATGVAIAFSCFGVAVGELPSQNFPLLIGVVAAGSMGICSLLAGSYSKS